MLTAPVNMVYSKQQILSLIAGDTTTLVKTLEVMLETPVYQNGDEFTVSAKHHLLHARNTVNLHTHYSSPFKCREEHDEACLWICEYMYHNNELPEKGFYGSVKPRHSGNQSPRAWVLASTPLIAHIKGETK